jgi:RNA-directed DNA polymerase
VHTGASWPDLDEVERRALGIQTKLHQWATAEPGRRLDDLATSSVTRCSSSWHGLGCGATREEQPPDSMESHLALSFSVLLDRLGDDLKARGFVPQWVRERTIPKSKGRSVFKPCSYGFLPRRRAQDAIHDHASPTPTSSSTIVEHPDGQADEGHCAKVTDPNPCSRARAFSLLHRRTHTIFSSWHLAVTE